MRINERRIARIENALELVKKKGASVVLAFAHTEQEADAAAKRLDAERPGERHVVVGFVPVDFAGWPTVAAEWDRQRREQ